MDVYEIRRANLEVLRHEFGGRLKAIADKLPGDKDYANYLSQLKTGARNMGTEFARFLELKVEKPRGWLDQPRGAAEAAAVYESLPASERKTWIEQGKVLAKNAVRIDGLSATIEPSEKEDEQTSRLIQESRRQKDAIQQAQSSKQGARADVDRGGKAGRSGVGRVRKGSRPAANAKRRVPSGS